MNAEPTFISTVCIKPNSWATTDITRKHIRNFGMYFNDGSKASTDAFIRIQTSNTNHILIVIDAARLLFNIM